MKMTWRVSVSVMMLLAVARVVEGEYQLDALPTTALLVSCTVAPPQNVQIGAGLRRRHFFPLLVRGTGATWGPLGWPFSTHLFSYGLFLPRHSTKSVLEKLLA